MDFPSSKEGNRRQPFLKNSLFRTSVNKGSGIFKAACQTLQEQYPTEEKAKGRNMFINSTFRQLHKPTASIRILQHTSTSSGLVSRKNRATAPCRQSETFCKELAQIDKISYDPGCSKRLQNPFHFAVK